MRGTRRPPGHDDEGQVLVLALAYALLAILLVTVVVSASAVHLERKRLLALADLAALAAADAIAAEAYYTGTGDARVVLDPDGVHDAVVEYLRTSPAAERFTGFELVAATTDDGRTARVTLRAVADVPLVNLVTAAWSEGVELVVTARARAGT